MNYKKIFITLASTVLLTVGLGTVNNIQAEELDTQELLQSERPAEHWRFRGVTTLGDRVFFEECTSEIIHIRVLTVDFSKPEADLVQIYPKVTIKVGDNQEISGNSSAIWNTLDVHKGDKITVILDDNELNTVEFIAEDDSKGTYNNNVNISSTRNNGQEIMITSITDQEISGYIRNISGNEPIEAMWAYLETSNGKRIVEDGMQFYGEEKSKVEIFRFSHDLDIKENEELKLGSYTQSENGYKDYMGHTRPIPKFHKPLITFKSPIAITSNDSYDTPIDFPSGGQGTLDGKITKITHQFIEGQVDPKYAGKEICLYECRIWAPHYVGSDGTTSIIDSNGEFRVLNNIWEFKDTKIYIRDEEKIIGYTDFEKIFGYPNFDDINYGKKSEFPSGDWPNRVSWANVPESELEPEIDNGGSEGDDVDPVEPIDPDIGGDVEPVEPKPEVKPDPEPEIETLTNQWQKVDGEWLRYDEKGDPVTEWFQEGAHWYHFNQEGKMQTGWQKINGLWYSFRDNGQMKRGWEKINGTQYFFTDSGRLAYDEWLPYGSEWFYVNEKGRMLKNEWQPYNGEWYYFKANGAMARNEKINGYKFNEVGICIS